MISHRSRIAGRSLIESLERRQLLASISGTVFGDLNTSRSFDPGEQGLAGWTVYIDENGNRRFDPGETFTLTDSTGRFEFTGLEPGVYALGVVLQPGFGQTFPSFEGSRASDYNITLNYTTAVSPAIREVFDRARARWEEIIVGDLPSFTDRRGTVDDIEIDVAIRPIDGPGRVLGQARTTASRPDSFLPARGEMTFDIADTNPADPQFYFTVLHEMAHAMGFNQGTWRDMNLVAGVSPIFSSNPRFLGANALREYNAAFGRNESSVPLQPGTTFDGSAVSHWRESIFNDELMTPFASGDFSPISRITIGAWEDMGYTVNYGAADPFRLSGGTGGAGSVFIPFQHQVPLESGQVRENVNFGVRENTRPRIGSVQVTPGPQAIGNILTIEATGVFDFENDPIRSVTFYRESNGIPGLQIGEGGDEFIGTRTKRSQGRWIITAPTENLPEGPVTYYARAVDDLGFATNRAGFGELVQPQSLPRNPTNLQAQVLSATRVLLSWDDRSDNESGFRLQRSTDPNFRSNVTTFVLGRNVTSLLLTDQQPATQFFYRVRAFNTAGNSSYSGRASALTYSAGEAVLDDNVASLRGSWELIMPPAGSSFGDGYLQTTPGQPARATLTPFIDFDGRYFVYIRFAQSPDNATNAPIDVITGNKVTTITVNQTRRGGGWVLLGGFDMKAGDLNSVRVRNTGANGLVNIDAVRFLPGFVPTGTPLSIQLGMQPQGPIVRIFSETFVAGDDPLS